MSRWLNCLKWLKRLLLWLALLAAGLCALAWLAYRPLPEQQAQAARPHLFGAEDTTLGRALADKVAKHPALTGIYSLPNGHDAFAARAALAEVAERSIDAQYYIWHDDTAGRLLLQSLRRAADRGVQVRLLLDDNNTGGMDAVLLALDDHPGIEVRVFNPMMHRNMRVLDYLSDFVRTNRRMHNKSFTVDNQATVVGGRNVGDEYFGAGDGVMFADLDVMAVGAVVQAVSSDFDRYWRSASTYPLSSIVADSGKRTDIGTAPASDPATQTYLQALTQSDLVQRLRSGNLAFEWAAARLVSDDPAKGLGQARFEQTLLGQLNQVMDGAKKELTIVSPYFVPTKKGAAHLIALAQRGVAVTILTNALSATDIAAVHAGYAKYRKDLLRAGIRIFELKPDATVMATRHGSLAGSSGASLHAKTFEVDGRQLFVGSFNMDPRSASLNTEMGLLIDSPKLAQHLPAALSSHGAANSYAVTLEGDSLRWSTQEGGNSLAYTQEPESTWLRRASVHVLSWLPIEWML